MYRRPVWGHTSFSGGLGYLLSIEHSGPRRKTMTSIKEKVEDAADFGIGVSIAAILDLIVVIGDIGAAIH